MGWASLYLTHLDGAMRRLASALRWASCTIFVRAGSRLPVSANDRGAIRGLLLAEGDGRWIGERNGVLLHVFPGFVFVLEFVFILEITEGKEQKFADEGQVGGVARRDAVLRDGLEEFAEDEVDVRGGHESAREAGSEFGA